MKSSFAWRMFVAGIASVLFACAPTGAPAPTIATQSPSAAPPTTPPLTGAQFQITLTGAAERPNPGDPDGTGTAKVTVNQEKGEVCYEIAFSNITLPATGFHIHAGPADVAGPIVVPFTAPTAGSSTGCASNVAPDLLSKIRQDSAGYYLNVHTGDFPGGAIRGQLPKESTSDPYAY